MTKTICNKCLTDLELGNYDCVTLEIGVFDTKTPDVHLCRSCYSSFMSWLRRVL